MNAENPSVQIARQADLRAPAMRWLESDTAPRDFLDRLLAEGLQAEAIRFLACALPKREAVWWGCLCVWQACRPGSSPGQRADLGSAMRWVLDPSVVKRQACVQAEPMAALRTATGSLALAVVWSGGSLSRPDLPVVPPPEYLTGRAVANAILLAAVQREPQQYLHHCRQFLTLGLEVADGKNRWIKDDEMADQIRVPETAEEMPASVAG